MGVVSGERLRAKTLPFSSQRARGCVPGLVTVDRVRVGLTRCTASEAPLLPEHLLHRVLLDRGEPAIEHNDLADVAVEQAVGLGG